MSTISLIAAVDRQYALGKNNQLLCHLPADLKFFKQTTLGKPVIMGRNTFESIGRPLPNRQNIVVSRSMPTIAGIEHATGIEDALQKAGEAPEIMIIGGASIYEQTLPLADRIYLTIIDNEFEADVFFPLVDWSNWDCTQKEFRPSDEVNTYNITFCTFQRTR
ncbi:dihydrofolate reductase [Legionella sp. CNM-4043-24]|uniref:dihydrofolate reductase n=1 Tax=Legionella sp. CNM-4043-24 TaxID=3421646 RepID=UPI00403A9A88